jgi:PKD repeat protein
MKNSIYSFLLLSAMLALPGLQMHAQDTGLLQKATLIGRAESMIKVPSIASQIASGTFIPAENKTREVNPKRWGANTSVPGKGLPKGNDPLWQQQKNTTQTHGKAPILTFEAASANVTPTDPTGAVGPNHFVNSWNTAFRIWDKAGNALTAPASLSTLFNSTDGDPIVMYDAFADRFIITEFYSNGFKLAICQGADPVNDGWYTYTFPTNTFPDYPKFSVWSDGYYITSNKDQNTAGSSQVVFALERAKIIAGDPTALMVGFPLTGITTSGFYSPAGFNANGPTIPPPGNAPIVYMQDDAWSGVSTDHLKIWLVNVNWTTPSSSTISSPQILNTAPFDGLFDGGSFSNLPQPSGSDIDALQATIMYMAQYRRFPTYNTVVFNFVVDLDGNDNHAGIRWYELRQPNDAAPWTIYQEGTYSQPDGHSAFSGNMCMDIDGNIALAYTTVSSTQHPSLRYTGRYASDPLGTMTIAEDVIVNGVQSDPSSRYGDYAQMTIDPSDGKTFWSDGEYFAGGTRKNQVGVFRFAPLTPTAAFIASTTLPCVNNTNVAFTNQSSGNATLFSWIFSPATVTYLDGTNNLSASPHVSFDALGSYSVSLTATNAAGSNTITKTNYIAVNVANPDFDASATNIVVNNPTTFTDHSTCDVNAWDWNFGEGASPATANTQGPHEVTYNTIGPKNVSLTVNGPLTKTKTEYINVIDTLFNISSISLSTCNGAFYDAGGPAGNYGNSQDYTMVFTPGTPGNSLQFTFSSFQLEVSANCNSDYLKIYNGTTLLAPLIGKFCGTNSPGTVTSSNTAGALTFVFHSNASNNFPGWVASVKCISNGPSNPQTLSALPAGSSQIDLSWTKNAGNDNVLLSWSPTGVFGVPINGTTYTTGEAITGGGIVLYSGSSTAFSHSGLNPGTIYYYKAFSYDAAVAYSYGMTANATTAALPTLAVTPPNQNVQSPSGNTLFNVLSNMDWTVVSNQTWCSVDPSGNGNGTITANFTENVIAATRIANITVTVNGLTPITVTISQEGAVPLLAVTPPDQPVSDVAGNTNFDVASNADWVVTSDQSWCTVTSSGSGNGQITATYLQNTALLQRIANVTVTVPNLNPVSVTVTQGGAAPMLAVSPADQTVSSATGTVNYIVTSNVDWVASSDSAWCSITQSGSGNGTIVADYLENPYHNARFATISVTGTGILTQTVILSQSLSTASVPEVPAGGMRIYPNPTEGMFVIAVDKGKFPSIEVTVMDLAGSKVINRKCQGEKEYHFDLGNVPQGCYFVRIDTGRDVLVKKLVIIR